MKKKGSFPFGLYLVTDDKIRPTETLREILFRALDNGVEAVQLREKTADARSFLGRLEATREIVSRYPGVPLIVNDRADIAWAGNADGVHVGQRDLPVSDVRRLIGKNKWIGLSIDRPDQISASENELADYLGVGPVFPTATKPEGDASAWGLENLKSTRDGAVEGTRIVAIGGIGVENARQVMEAGADGLAVVSCVFSAARPDKVCRTLRKIVEAYRTR